MEELKDRIISKIKKLAKQILEGRKLKLMYLKEYVKNRRISIGTIKQVP